MEAPLVKCYASSQKDYAIADQPAKYTIDNMSGIEAPPASYACPIEGTSVVEDNVQPDEDDEAAREELSEKLRREREARAQALTLEIVGDLPYAEVKPPENVLFVCKLNPVTEG